MCHKLLISILFCCFCLSGLVKASEYDLDISQSEISVEVSRNGDGNYEYVYTVVASPNNKSKITSLMIDVSCEAEDYGTFRFSEPDDPRFMGNVSTDLKHVPIQPFMKYGQFGGPAVTVDNFVSWPMSLKPGETATGARIVSPMAPGLRTYSIFPSTFKAYQDTVITGVKRFVNEDDYISQGAIIGPSCPNALNDLFNGSTSRHGETRQINELITYSSPQSRDVVLSKAESLLILEIHYSRQIDAKTFVAKPEAYKKYFSPVPGTSQTVKIKLEDIDTENSPFRLVLSVYPIDNRTPLETIKPLRADTDIFRVRFR